MNLASAIPRLFLPCLILASGCAGYQLGPTNELAAGTHSIEVAPVVNHSEEPRLSDPVMQALRQRIQSDGTYLLETHGDGDVLMEVEITELIRSGLSFQPRDIITVRDYQLYLRAQVKVRMAASGRVLMDRELTGRTTIRLGDDLDSAERQAIPLAAEDLARNIVGLLADGDWGMAGR